MIKNSDTQRCHDHPEQIRPERPHGVSHRHRPARWMWDGRVVGLCLTAALTGSGILFASSPASAKPTVLPVGPYQAIVKTTCTDLSAQAKDGLNRHGALIRVRNGQLTFQLGSFDRAAREVRSVELQDFAALWAHPVPTSLSARRSSAMSLANRWMAAQRQLLQAIRMLPGPQRYLSSRQLIDATPETKRLNATSIAVLPRINDAMTALAGRPCTISRG